MKVIRRILLAVILVGAVAAGVLFMGKYSALNRKYIDELAAAETELQSAQEALKAMDRSSGEGAAAWEAWTEEVLSDNEAQLETLTQENSKLTSSISEKETELEKALEDEDTAYYMAIYNSLKEGMSKVEGYIEQSN